MGESFICGICLHEADNRFSWRIQDQSIPPICKRCEMEWSTYTGWHGRGHDKGKVTSGALRDRREARRLFAVAEALEHIANRQEWTQKHGCA